MPAVEDLFYIWSDHFGGRSESLHALGAHDPKAGDGPQRPQALARGRLVGAHQDLPKAEARVHERHMGVEDDVRAADRGEAGGYHRDAVDRRDLAVPP